VSTFGPFQPIEPPPHTGSEPTDSGEPVPSGPDYYEPSTDGSAPGHPSAAGEPEEDADDDGDSAEDFEPGRVLTPGRMVAGAVAAVVVLIGVLFLSTFSGATGSAGGPIPASTAGSDSEVTTSASAADTVVASTPSTQETLPSGGPASPGSGSAHVPSSRSSSRLPHSWSPVEPTGSPPRSSAPVTAGGSVTTSTAEATPAQMLIAGNAEYFFHAMATGDGAAMCGFWDPTSMTAYLSRVGVASCTELNPDTLTSPAERSVDATFAVDEPKAIVVTGDTASIPAAAIHPGGGLLSTVRMRLDHGLWRVVFAGPSTPRTSAPISTPPISTPPSTAVPMPPSPPSRSSSPLLSVPSTDPRR
jgi:hypothetical protein